MTLNNSNLSNQSSGWVLTTLSGIAEEIYRYPTFYGFDHANKGVPVIRGEHIQKDGTISHDWSDYWFVTEEISRKFPQTIMQVGDLVMSVRGSVGKLGIIDELLQDAQLSPNCIRISLVRDLCSPKFAFYYLKSNLGLGSVLSLTNSTTIQTIKASSLAEVSIPLPPYREQKRIVVKIEELFTKLDAGVESLKAAKKQIKRYRQSVLKAAVEGELTREWRERHNDELEPASVLLERILKERREKWEADQLAKMQAQGKTPKDDKWKAKYQEPVAPDISNLSELPKEWKWTFTQQLGEVQLGRQRSPRNRSKNYPTKYIRAANITERGLDLSDVLDMEFEPHEVERYLLENGDIVLSEASGSPTQVGKPAIWRNQLSICCFQNTVIRLRPNGIPSEYLFVVFKGYYVNGLFSKIAAGVGINHLSADKFSTIPVPLPPLAEQAQIVAEVERRLSIADEIEASLDAEMKRAERLRQSILKRAFEGKLAPQDPNDEPASVLLERIKAERAEKESRSSNGKRTARGRKSPATSDEPTLPFE